MANTYKTIRLQPSVKSMNVGEERKDNVVDSLGVGVTATADDGCEEYLEEMVKLPDPATDSYIEFADIDEAWATEIANRHIEENNWHEELDKSIEAKRAQPMLRSFLWQQPESGE